MIFRWLETRLRSVIYFFAGVLIGGLIFWMITSGMIGEMLGPQLMGMLQGIVGLLLPLLESWGQMFYDFVGAIFDPSAEYPLGYIIFIIIGAAIIVGFAFLQIKQPEEKVEDD